MAETHIEHSHQDSDSEHWVPERTTPQGTLAHSLDSGYEDRDVNISALLKWFAALAVVTALCMVAIGIAFNPMLSMGKAGDDIPSEVFRGDQTPPEPRLIPNPQDHADRPLEALRTPIQYGADERKAEREALAEHGLFSGGVPTIPADRAAEVAAEINGRGPADAPPEATRALTDSSGGTNTEDPTR